MGKFFTLLIIILIIGGVYYIYPQIEWSSPEVDIKLASENVGMKPFDVEIREKGKGIKEVKVVLIKDGVENVLVNKVYPEGVMGDTVTVSINPGKLGIKDGPAELRVEAEDRSRIKVFSGNKTTESRNLKLDLVPPAVDLISTEHYINHGGSGLVVYKTSPDVEISGVSVGDYFFPGYKGNFSEDDVYLSFFAYPYNVEPDTNIVLIAEDAAGNRKTAAVPYRLKNINYRSSNINISEDFIENVMVPLAGESGQSDHREIFLKVNSELRKANDAKIKEVGSNSTGEIMWKGAFHQLSNSKVEANFADHRTYIYNEEPIDEQYHLGYDLAVTKRYPIEAANSGVVTHAGELGIYGNAVIIDHGMGVASLYGHMSTIDVNVGDKVKKKQVIGKTGQTGLAAGDHLHYGVYVNGVAVRPIEWWDNKWIKDNVLLKIDQARAEFGMKPAQKKQN
ncbi:MAG: M23 family metallopeptidase [Deltaproteobacteria bacterium]